ncbi:MAG TPA: SufS family cysteine desulfurase [Planctomycetaceae bacterium]|nr:SufS family cysteine desulfurase [Planctomycetaceae bacterium]HQZ66487.1 SufS family cysteine desulfurase [Planctomycetaceae bacterium]
MQNSAPMLLTLDEIFEEFADLERQDQSLYLLELGDNLPELPDEARTEENRVHGCQSQVWLTTEINGTGEDATFSIKADSDSNIVRGLIAILIASYNSKTSRQILEYDIDAVFQRLNLQQHITPQRRNGLRGMVDRVLTLARLHLATSRNGAATPVQVSPVANNAACGSPAPTASKRVPFNAEDIRREFPVLCRMLPSGSRPIYLDSAASAQKPQCVIDKEREVEEQYFANAHRGTYQFGQRIDEEFEGARGKIANFLHAPSSENIIFTPGTTIGLNMIASGWGRRYVQPGDEILTTVMEHHANFVPWQQLAKERGATLKLIPLTADGRLDMEQLDSVLTKRTRLLAVTGMSNVLGTVIPIRELTRRAHAVGACVVVDVAQSVPHMPVDVVADDVDFLAFSGHKLYGPTGIGVLYGKPERLEEMDPIIFGGHMISEVAIERTTWSAPPAKFEAGTMPIVQAIALGTAVDWVQKVGLDTIHAHEQSVLAIAMGQLSAISGIKIYGPGISDRGGIVSFRIDGVHPEDLAAILDKYGVFTRHGHHCTMPLHTHLGVSATTRVSLAVYNSADDITALMDALNVACHRLIRKHR